jgi:hypothetical protein
VDGCAIEVRKPHAQLSRALIDAKHLVFVLIFPPPLHRHSSECENDGLPSELCNAIAVADSLLEPRAVSENATIQKAEEKEEIMTRDRVGNEESASKARTNQRLFFMISRSNGT